METFISYSWDSDNHKDWVRYFTRTLRKNGIDAHLDQYDLSPGDDVYLYMEKSVRSAKYIIIVCTPIYVNKANARSGGVGNETILIAPFVFDHKCGKKIIPIVREKNSSLYPTPDYSKGRIFMDFSDDQTFSIQMESLLRHLFRQPKLVKPPLGPEPNFADPMLAQSFLPPIFRQPKLVEPPLGPEPNFADPMLAQSLSINKETDNTEIYNQLKMNLETAPNNDELLSSFGRSCIYLGKLEEAETVFNKILDLDSEFESFEKIHSTVRALARKKKPFAMKKTSRVAMLYLGLLNGDKECLLSGAYDTDDQEINFIVGSYYLEIFDAELDTAVAYFIQATKNEPANSNWVKMCDNAINHFMRPEKMIMYFYPTYQSFQEIVQIWNEHKLKLCS